jgi:hypothetical protein
MSIAIVLASVGAAISILNDNTQVPGTEIYVRHIAIGLVAVLVIMGFALRAKQDE